MTTSITWMRRRAFVTSLTFPLPTFDLQTQRTMRVVYLKELPFFNVPFWKEKRKVWLCVRSICMISWFYVYIKLFYVYIYSSPKAADWKWTFPAKFNWSKLIMTLDIHTNHFYELIPSKSFLYYFCVDIEGISWLNSPAEVNGSMKIPARCFFLNGLPLLKQHLFLLIQCIYWFTL